MFKGFTDVQGFHSFPKTGYGMNPEELYGFPGVRNYLSAQYLANSGISDLGAISTWLEPIGNIVFEQNTASRQPRLVLNNPLFNDLPTVEYTTSSKGFTSNFPLVTGKEYTIAIVVNSSNGSVLNTVFGQDVNTEITFFLGRSTSPRGVNYWPAGSGGERLIGVDLFSALPRIIIITPFILMVDGEVEDANTLPLPALSFNGLGHRIYSSSWGLQGNIAEVIFYKDTLSESEMLLLSDRINEKYAIY